MNRDRIFVENENKVYVDVTEQRTKGGELVPIDFTWEDGTRYQVDRVLDARPAASLKAGGCGMRYTVRVKNHTRFMFFEQIDGEARWFIERI